ncbi:hypothetical protein BGW41_005108 [Actinomortierella wolfii]|nr:hypothetical protein BGW41_005108 [Actinomortierella wolfii]
MPQQQQPAHPLLALPKLSLERDREAMTANVASASPTVVTTPTTTTSSSVVTANTAAAAAAAAAGGVLSPPNSSCSGPVPSSSPVHSPTAITSGTSTSVASNTSHALPLSAFSQGGTTPTHATSSLVYVREYHSLETNQEQQPRPAHHWSSTEHYTPSDSYDRMDNSPLGRPPSLTRMRSSSASQHQQHRRIRSSVATHPSPNPISSESMGMLDVSVSTRRRTQSAQYSPSMRLALADPALSKSLQSSPVSSRSSWEHAQQQNAKKRFEANVRRYYHQLVVGCERPLGQCTNRLCRTSLHSPKLTNDAAAILSVQLAARPQHPMFGPTLANMVLESTHQGANLPLGRSSCDEDDEARIQRGTLRRRWPRLYGENRVGLGVFPMSVIGSRPIGDGHGYCPSPLHILSGGRHRSSKSGGRRSRRSKSLVFGSSRDPDSDGSLSSVSRSLSDEDASDVQEVQMKSPPSNTKQEPDSTLTQEGPWDGGMDSGVSSDSEDALCLGFMNLQLLRQAIATYNSSRLDDTLMPNLAPSQSEPQLVPPPARSSGALKSKASAITSTFHYSQSTPSLCRSPSWSTVSSDEDTTPSRRPRRYPGVSSPSSSAAAKTKWGQGDSRFLLESIRAVFSSASALGSSFLVSSEASDLELSSTVNVGGIDVGSLREAYEMLIELEPSSLFSIHGTNAIEILLARLELEMLEGGQVAWGDFEMRAIFILLMNPYLFEQPYQESLLNRTLAIFIALPDQDKLVEWISHLDEEGMAQLVTLFKVYLSAHFTPKPKGDHHPAVCAVKALEILYRANEMHIQRIRQVDQAALRSASRDEDPFETTKSTSSTEGLSYKYFYSDVIERLHFKDEYRTWRESLDPSNVDREFSYFAYPFLISPSCKAHIMNLDAMNQMSAFYEEACVRHAMLAQTQRLFSDAISSATTEVQKGIRAITSPYLVLELTRSNIVQETFDQLVAKHADLKKPLKVAFVDVGEEGMDQGGVTKEFFQVMLERVFDSNFGLFKELEETRAWWIEGTLDGSCPVDESDEDVGARLVEYELVGILIGLALYNGVILGVRFPSILYRKLLDWPVDLQSFTDSFPALGQGLRQMLEWSDGDVYDVFMRNFEISYEHMGQVVTLPLIPGGEDIEVTNDERQRYVELYMDHYANIHVSKEFAAFQRGFLKICDGDALKMLRPEELELLLCGNPVLDMHDLELACLYDDGYSAHHELMQDFWDIVHNEMTTEQHKQLLAFVTGSDRVPIRGLRDLVFVIQRNGPDSDRLPTALTCFSRLLLPEYASREKMKERLVTAIENSHGFGLV